MRKIPKRTRIRVGAASVLVAIAIVLVLAIFRTSDAARFSSEIFLVATLISLIPSAVLDFLNQRWIDSIEDQMPALVRGVSEYQETGMTLIDAFDDAVKNKLVKGPLSQEIKKLTVQMSWGLTFEESLRRLRDRIGSAIVNRFCVLVLEASQSGGQIKKVFTATSGFMEEMKEIDREAKSQMRPYLLIIYATFFIFLFTSIILVNSFFAPIENIPSMLSGVSMMGVSVFKDFYYRTMLVSALAGGFMAGKIGERRVTAGMKHSVVLIIIGYIIFLIMIPPNWMAT